MKLYEKLPMQIEYNGKKYRLKPWFDRCIEVQDVFLSDWTDKQKIEYATWLLIKGKVKEEEKAEVLNKAIEVIFGKNEKKEKPNKVFDFEQDSDYIIGAFWQTYGINLLKRRKWYEKPLHWWEFLALFQSLPENTKFSEIVQIRLRPLPKPNKYNAEEIANLRQLKQTYALNITEEEKDDRLQEGLLSMVMTLRAGARKEG